MPPSLTRPLTRALWPLTLFLLALGGLLAAGPVRAQTVSFTDQPTATVSTQQINNNATTTSSTMGVTVQVMDAAGTAVQNATVSIALTSPTSANGGSATLGGTTTGTTDVNGNLTFGTLTIDKVGAYTLTATATLPNNGGAVTSNPVSNTFNVTPGPASSLAFGTIQDARLEQFLNAGTTPPGVIVQVQDASGNPVPGQSVTVALTPTAGSTATLSGTVNQTTDASGNAVFPDLQINQVGSDSLSATTAGLTPVTSNTFNVTYATPVVTKTGDDGSAGTLRSVLRDVAPGATVTFDPTVFANRFQTIILQGGQIAVTQPVTLIGPSGGPFSSGPFSGVTVRADFRSRVFAVTNGPTAFSNLTIQYGQAPGSGEGAPFYGQGGGVAVSPGVQMALTNCTLYDNRADNGGNGGGVFSAGALTLADCTFQSNSATYGGGGLYSEGTAVVVGCSFYDNQADNNNNGTGDGGGVYNGGALVVTSCTFTSNRANSGSGVFSVGSSATLTDDILYFDYTNNNNNGAGFSEVDGTNLAVSYSDVENNAAYQSGSSAGDSTVPDANHNISTDPLFNNRFNSNNVPQPGSGSPVFNRGTAGAPGFRPTDLFGNPYFSGPTLGAVEPQNESLNSHVLWTNPNGRTIVWDLNTGGGFFITGNFDPQSVGGVPYTATALATSPSGLSYVLWNAPDGHAMLWGVSSTGAQAVTEFTYGPFSDDGTASTIWQATAVSVGNDGVPHLLWTNPNGRTILWDVNPNDGSFAIKGNYNGFSDDGTPATLWKAFALATGQDNLSHVLWGNSDHHTLLWNLDANDDQPVASAPQGNTSTASSYGVFEDDGTANTIWAARALSVGPDGAVHLLWNNPDGRTILWNVSRDGSFSIPGNYPPVGDPLGNGGYAAVSLATGGDNLNRLAWDSPSGDTYFWDVNPNGSHVDFFFPPFLDDGTRNTIWKAAAISAAEVTNNNNGG